MREKRELKGLTQQQLADLIGRDRSLIAKIENGSRPSVETAKKIAAILGFEWTRFFDDAPDSKEQVI